MFTITLRALAFAAIVTIPASAVSQTTGNGLPAVSPDGRRIAFLGTRDGHDHLFVIGADGTGQHEVTAAGLDAGLLRWTAAGDLVFAGAGADTGRVFAVGPDGTGRRLVANVPGRSPVLSPDGSRVLFLSGSWTSTALVVADSDGSNSRVLAGGRATAWNGAWSPDGKQIAYTYGDSTRLLQVHIIAPDGSGDRAITHTTPAEGSAQLPVWSPDGRQLAMQVNNLRSNTAEIWIVDLPSGAIRRLSRSGAAGLDETPSWFPDGRRLAFQSNRTGTMEVWVMNADGSNPHQITGRSH